MGGVCPFIQRALPYRRVIMRDVSCAVSSNFILRYPVNYLVLERFAIYRFSYKKIIQIKEMQSCSSLNRLLQNFGAFL